MIYLIITTIIFLVGFLIKLWLDRSAFHDFLIVIGPYVAILVINNLLMVQHFSFYEINTSAQRAILFGETAYLAGSIGGSLLANRDTNRISRLERQRVFEPDKCTLKFSSACCYTLFACLTVVIHIGVKIVKIGIVAVMADDFAELSLAGLSGHLFISTYALVPVIFYESVQKWSKVGLCICILAMLCAFSTFVKYNVIIMLLIIGLYYILRKPTAMKKVVAMMFCGIAALFAINYLMLFLAQGADDSNMLRFLISHLWMYISSGTMMMNYTIGDISVYYTVWDFMVQSMGAIPNMFLGVFTDFQFTTSHSFQSVLDGMQIMSATGEQSNALSIVATLYSDGGHIPSFTAAMAVWGCINCMILQRTKFRSFSKVSIAGVIFISFSMLSFFGNYWMLTMPWEMIVYALLFSRLFDEKRGINIKW